MNIENTYMKNAGGIGALGNMGLDSQFPLRKFSPTDLEGQLYRREHR
jgi:hypothetical protein